MMDQWLLFVLCSLTVFRLSLLITREQGPGNVAKKLRNSVPRESSWWDGLRCPYCVSVTMAAAITVYVVSFEWIDASYAPLWWLSTSAASSIIHHVWFSDFKR